MILVPEPLRFSYFASDAPKKEKKRKEETMGQGPKMNDAHDVLVIATVVVSYVAGGSFEQHWRS